jgi:hypothetical protein
VTNALAKFQAYLDRSLVGWTRVVLALLVIPLVFALSQPLWRIRLEAPQYPQGLQLDIYAYTLEGGNHGQHLSEINTLNHYIGMHKIDRGELSDLDWLPFALGALALLTLRAAAIGNVRSLIDQCVLTTYVLLFSMGRFVFKMYVYGHNLAPDAPVKVAPFTPALLGTKQIANFTSHSGPMLGTFLVTVFYVGLLAVTVGHLWSGRRAAVRAEQTSGATVAVG